MKNSRKILISSLVVLGSLVSVFFVKGNQQRQNSFPEAKAIVENVYRADFANIPLMQSWYGPTSVQNSVSGMNDDFYPNTLAFVLRSNVLSKYTSSMVRLQSPAISPTVARTYAFRVVMWDLHDQNGWVNLRIDKNPAYNDYYEVSISVASKGLKIVKVVRGSRTVLYSKTGIKSILNPNANDVSVYQNPTTGELSVTYGGVKLATVYDTSFSTGETYVGFSIDSTYQYEGRISNFTISPLQ